MNKSRNNSLKNHCASCQQADDFQYPLPADSKLQDALAMRCDECHRQVLYISVDQASSVVRKHPKTVRNWVRQGRVKVLILADGRYLICYSSLFRPALKNNFDAGRVPRA